MAAVSALRTAGPREILGTELFSSAGSHPPSGPTSIVGVESLRTDPSRSATATPGSAATSAAEIGPATSGIHTCRDCSAADRAIARRRVSALSPFTPSHRTTERAVWRIRIRSTPSSVSFWTANDVRSVFTAAIAMVIDGSERATATTSPSMSMSSPNRAGRQRPAPSQIVIASPLRIRRTRAR